MWTCVDIQNFKRPTNCSSVDTVTAFCKLIPKTNRHVRNDVQMSAEERYNMGIYLFIQKVYRIRNLDCVWYLYLFAMFANSEYYFYFCEFVS